MILSSLVGKLAHENNKRKTWSFDQGKAATRKKSRGKEKEKDGLGFEALARRSRTKSC